MSENDAAGIERVEETAPGTVNPFRDHSHERGGLPPAFATSWTGWPRRTETLDGCFMMVAQSAASRAIPPETVPPSPSNLPATAIPAPCASAIGTMSWIHAPDESNVDHPDPSKRSSRS